MIEGFEGEEFVEVPRWVLRNIFEPRGEKQPKRKLLQVGDAERIPVRYTSTPQNSTVALQMYGVRQSAGFIDTPAGIVPIRGTIVKVGQGRGNLDENDYAFWVGNPNPSTSTVTCRWCRKMELTLWDRMRHQKEGLIRKHGEPVNESCAKRLQRVYKQLLKQHTCVVCMAPQMRQRWGIPICKGNCELRWRFFTQYEFLSLRELLPPIQERMNRQRMDFATGDWNGA